MKPGGIPLDTIIIDVVKIHSRKVPIEQRDLEGQRAKRRQMWSIEDWAVMRQ